MEGIKHTFFEDPTYAYVALGLAVVVLAAIWFERRDHRLLLGMLAPLAVAGAVFLVERMVVTDREEIIAVSGRIAAHIEGGQVEEAAAWLDDGPLGIWESREAAIKQAEAFLHEHPIQRVALSRHDVEVQGRRATMKVTTVIEFGGQGTGQRVLLAWDLEWVKLASGWRIRAVAYKFGL